MYNVYVCVCVCICVCACLYLYMPICMLICPCICASQYIYISYTFFSKAKYDFPFHQISTYLWWTTQWDNQRKMGIFSSSNGTRTSPFFLGKMPRLPRWWWPRSLGGRCLLSQSPRPARHRSCQPARLTADWEKLISKMSAKCQYIPIFIFRDGEMSIHVNSIQ